MTSAHPASNANERAAAALSAARSGDSEPVLIAGGGIGGLATAIALSKRGIRSHVLERRPAFHEEGAGIQLGPNGMRILRDLGVAAALAPYAAAPEGVRVRDGRSGTELARLPLGKWIETRHGAPYWVAQRQDLHASLQQVAQAEPHIALSLDFPVAQIAADANRVAVAATSGATCTGTALVGADGIWSVVREAVFHTPAPRCAGKSAARAVIPIAQAPAAVHPRETGLWLFPNAHVVHYPVAAGTAVAMVVIVEDAAQDRDWSAPIPPSWVAERLPPCAAPLRDLIGAVDNWRKWALQALEPDYPWSRGRVTLLGDAAHPVMPFLAQGGVLALEDAVVLAATLAAHKDDVASALRRYERQRRPRTAKVAAASRNNGRIYHMSGPLAAARNLALRALPGTGTMRRYDWLYGWRA